jgi:hypothetical protein
VLLFFSPKDVGVGCDLSTAIVGIDLGPKASFFKKRKTLAAGAFVSCDKVVAPALTAVIM